MAHTYTQLYYARKALMYTGTGSTASGECLNRSNDPVDRMLAMMMIMMMIRNDATSHVERLRSLGMRAYTCALRHSSSLAIASGDARAFPFSRATPIAAYIAHCAVHWYSFHDGASPRHGFASWNGTNDVRYACFRLARIRNLIIPVYARNCDV